MKTQPNTPVYNVYRTGLIIPVIVGTYFARDKEEAIDMHCEEAYEEDSCISMKRCLDAECMDIEGIYDAIKDNVEGIVNIVYSIDENKGSSFFSNEDKKQWIGSREKRIVELNFILNQIKDR